MPIFEFSEKDANRGLLIDPPGWYLVRVDNIGEGTPSKGGDSLNYLVDGTIIKNVDDGSEKFAGKPTPFWLFNSKALGFATGFLRAFGVDVQAGRFDMSQTKGQVLEMFIGQKVLDDGRIVNDIPHQYRPVSQK